jgi:hypothetical protein
MPITYTCDHCHCPATAPVSNLSKRIEQNGDILWVSVSIQNLPGVCCKTCFTAKLEGVPALTDIDW